MERKQRFGFVRKLAMCVLALGMMAVLAACGDNKSAETASAGSVYVTLDPQGGTGGASTTAVYEGYDMPVVAGSKGCQLSGLHY